MRHDPKLDVWTRIIALTVEHEKIYQYQYLITQKAILILFTDVSRASLRKLRRTMPRCSMYCLFTNIYPKCKCRYTNMPYMEHLGWLLQFSPGHPEKTSRCVSMASKNLQKKDRFLFFKRIPSGNQRWPWKFRINACFDKDH